MLSTTTANRTCCIIDSERQETGIRSFILWACASLIAKSMTSQSLGLLHSAAPATAELINCTIHQLRMLKNLLNECGTLSTKH